MSQWVVDDLSSSWSSIGRCVWAENLICKPFNQPGLAQMRLIVHRLKRLATDQIVLERVIRETDPSSQRRICRQQTIQAKPEADFQNTGIEPLLETLQNARTLQKDIARLCDCPKA